MRAFIFYITILLLLLQACKKEPHDYDNHRTSYFENINNQIFNDSVITCLTYNIQLGFKANQSPWDADQIGGDHEHIQNIVDIINHIDPDIIALQEVPRNRSNTVIKNFIEELATLLQMNYAFGAHGYNDVIYPMDGEWGNAILTKFHIIEIHNIEVIYVDTWKKRSILDTWLKINDSINIHSISLHYGNVLSEFEDGIRNTKNYIQNLTDPIILMGDYNPQFGTIDLIKRFESEDLADPDSTFLHGGDRILFSNYFFYPLEAGKRYDTINWTSDHPANFCTLGLKNY
jgi:endonuclease/exonuclease/phosphatase family metal-dependent hydrolase